MSGRVKPAPLPQRALPALKGEGSLCSEVHRHPKIMRITGHGPHHPRKPIIQRKPRRKPPHANSVSIPPPPLIRHRSRLKTPHPQKEIREERKFQSRFIPPPLLPRRKRRNP